MQDTDSSRRIFMMATLTGLGSAWLDANWPSIAEAAEMARRAQTPGFTFFTPAQATEIDAITAQIVPTTDTPGAREAQVVYFIDLALTTFAQDKQQIYKDGLAELSTHTKSFATLPTSDQIALLTSIEKSTFFRTVRDHTVMGMFSAPQHGGNYNKIGWKMIGFDDSLNFRAPFGAYDQA